jgi:ribonuclease J
MSDKIRIFALGGLDEDGKNCTVVEINGDIFVVDCGIRYPDKTMPGIDYVIPNFQYLKDHKDHVKAYLLSHGHDDQMGALVYLYKDVPAPIYGSSVTLAMFKTFSRHVGIDPSGYDVRLVEATSSFVVANRRIDFFRTAHNIAQSSGIAIHTDKGNVIFTSDFVVENNANPNYLHDMNAIAKIAENPTLVLLSESVYASRAGYTAPDYKLTPLIEQTVKDAPGRVFVALFSANFYNIDEVISLAIQNRKKIIPYDEETAETIANMQNCGQLLIPRENFSPIDDLNRYRAQDIIVLMLGYGVRLYGKIALLAAGQNETKQVILNSEDTFITACPSNDNTEIEATDALDQLYRSGCLVLNVPKKKFLKMHASEEDLKMMIALLKPSYYIPIKGFYKDLLANAQVALSMGVNLKHNNVFLLENGLSCLFDETGGHVLDEGIAHGDVMIDGIGVGDVGAQVIDDREKLSQGVVILAATISKSTHKIMAGPDVQIRGLVFLKDSDAILRDVSKIFLSTLQDELQSQPYDVGRIRDDVYDKCLRAIRRQTGKEPMVLPLIIEIA